MKRVALAALTAITTGFVLASLSSAGLPMKENSGSVAHGSQAPPKPLPRFDKWDAHIFLESRLRKSLGAVYSNYLTDCRKTAPTRAKCKISWGIGDLGFKGTGYVWLTGDGYSRPVAHASWSIVRTNYYCRSVKKRPLSRCRATIRGKGSGWMMIYSDTGEDEDAEDGEV